MSDQSRPMTQALYEKAPSTPLAVKFLTAATIGGTLLFLSGLTLTGTVIALIMATPVLVLFSPILVPAAIAVFLATVGFLVSGGCGVTAITHPPGADHLDYARTKIADKARDMTERAKEYGQYVQQKAQEATQAS
ncbi:oleosin [Citrus sinensis]|uniref:Oleosin n=1 Tax=Citrus sinensis TaxID=2711 RepID=A0ACB8NPY7_CITSI|nr:oleosin [Citrus sinensis]KAH9799806.1 oleosin [Citrus sinensis]